MNNQPIIEALADLIESVRVDLETQPVSMQAAVQNAGLVLQKVGFKFHYREERIRMDEVCAGDIVNLDRHSNSWYRVRVVSVHSDVVKLQCSKGHRISSPKQFHIYRRTRQ